MKMEFDNADYNGAITIFVMQSLNDGIVTLNRLLNLQIFNPVHVICFNCLYLKSPGVEFCIIEYVYINI